MKNLFKTCLTVLSLCPLYTSISLAAEKIPRDFYFDEKLASLDSGDESSDWGSDIEEIEPVIKDYTTRKYMREMISPRYPFSDARSCYLLALHYKSEGMSYKKIGTQALVYYHEAMLKYHEDTWPRQLGRHIRDVYNVSEKDTFAKRLYKAMSESSAITQVKPGRGFALCRPGFCDSY